ncbi:MAG: bifunctional riboflavin kinase/FAD synthetase [Hyphomicrobiaceae bacterium]
MQVVRSQQPVPAELKGSVIAIGNFDGVHLGHQAVIRKEEGLARSLGAPFAAMLFEPHPRQHFQPDRPFFRLTSLAYKLELLAELGLDMAVVVDFDAALASLTARDFVQQLLVDWLAVRHVVVGYDFNFGRGRLGTPEVLRALGQDLGFGVTVVEAAVADGMKHSSSRVRELLEAGDAEGAAAVLGRFFQVEGVVIGGAKIGTGIGFPTANLALEPGMALKHGIYAARVHVDGQTHDAAAYLGKRPTIDNGKPVLEVFLLDFDGDLYGKSIRVEFVAHLREDRAFPGLAELSRQIAEDVAQSRRVLQSQRKALADSGRT